MGYYNYPLCFEPLMSTTVFNCLMYYFTFVLCMRLRLMSKQAIMARALIYKSLSLFMIKSLKTKLGRSRGGQICCGCGLLPATCGIIPADGCTAALAAARCARHEHGLNIF